MPLWFVFLNAAIATDLLLSQLLRISVIKLQAIHKWYLPVASLTAFTLALPLLLYHSAYQPTANVFSVQFPSVLSVTLYYILAFDLWLAVGILYCFIVVSIVVSVILIKLRQKRAAWVRQNMSQMESGWTTHPEATPKNELNQEPVENSDSDQNNAFTAVASEAETSPTSTGSSTDGNQTTLPSGNIYIIDNSRGSCTDGFQLDTLASGQIQSSSNKELLPAHAVAASSTTNPSDTLMSGMTFTEFHESLNHGDNNAFEAIAERSLPAHQKSVLQKFQQ
ncbi:hypothetical protein EV174_003312 [Coemansia sp. RSA 2320]|nr:hypothetical protein EV174_003312 [Coemansia sp. RSA 2320]